jgi:hypothetical protein
MTAEIGRDVVNIEIDDDSLSPAERIGIVLSDWLRDHPSRRRKWRALPSEAVLFALVAAVVLDVIAGTINGVAYWSSFHIGTTGLVFEVTVWADLPNAAILLATALLALYESRRSCDEFESWIGVDAGEDDAPAGDGPEAGVEDLRRLPRNLRRTRSATVFIAILGLLTAAAALAALGVQIYLAVSAGGSFTWNGYLALVLSEAAPTVAGLACLLIASRAWAEESELLRVCGSSELLRLRDQTPH